MQMDNENDNALNTQLAECFVASPSPDFHARIADAAFALPQAQPSSLWQELKTLLNDACLSLHMPRPAITMAALLVLGLSIGFGATTTIENDTNTDIATVIYGERGLI